jgi:steroid 5-alpha reductase family enzyme
MIVLYLDALAAITLCLSVPMAGAWMVPRRTGNFGWVDTIRRFSPGLVGPGSALWPIAGAALNPRLWLAAALLAPVFMYWILVHVTGIPPLEQQMLRSRGARYRDYQSRTSAFFPLPPHKGVVT